MFVLNQTPVLPPENIINTLLIYGFNLIFKLNLFYSYVEEETECYTFCLFPVIKTVFSPEVHCFQTQFFRVIVGESDWMCYS